MKRKIISIGIIGMFLLTGLSSISALENKNMNSANQEELKEISKESIKLTDSDITACFTYSPNTPVVNQEVTFDASCTGGWATYEWDFGDGTTVNTEDETQAHIYENKGDYKVTLTVKNIFNSSETDSVTEIVTVGIPDFKVDFNWFEYFHGQLWINFSLINKGDPYEGIVSIHFETFGMFGLLNKGLSSKSKIYNIKMSGEAEKIVPDGGICLSTTSLPNSLFCFLKLTVNRNGNIEETDDQNNEDLTRPYITSIIKNKINKRYYDIP